MKPTILIPLAGLIAMATATAFKQDTSNEDEKDNWLPPAPLKKCDIFEVWNCCGAGETPCPYECWKQLCDKPAPSSAPKKPHVVNARAVEATHAAEAKSKTRHHHARPRPSARSCCDPNVKGAGSSCCHGRGEANCCYGTDCWNRFCGAEEAARPRTKEQTVVYTEGASVITVIRPTASPVRPPADYCGLKGCAYSDGGCCYPSDCWEYSCGRKPYTETATDYLAMITPAP